MAKKRENVKILSKVVEEIFRKNPEVVEEAQTIKSAYKYLTNLVLKELEDISNLDLDTVFNEIKWKLWTLR